jgi:hypothetical protein
MKKVVFLFRDWSEQLLQVYITARKIMIPPYPQSLLAHTNQINLFASVPFLISREHRVICIRRL